MQSRCLACALRRLHKRLRCLKEHCCCASKSGLNCPNSCRARARWPQGRWCWLRKSRRHCRAIRDHSCPKTARMNALRHYLNGLRSPERRPNCDRSTGSCRRWPGSVRRSNRPIRPSAYLHRRRHHRARQNLHRYHGHHGRDPALLLKRCPARLRQGLRLKEYWQLEQPRLREQQQRPASPQERQWH